MGDPKKEPVLFLIAEQESIQAGRDFAAQELKAGRPTFYHDAKVSADSLKEPGIHFLYKPDLTPSEIVEESQRALYTGIRVRPKTVLPAARSLIDQRIGTGIDNFKERMKAKQAAKEPYILMNTPAQNAVATAEWTQSALYDGLTAPWIREGTKDAASGKWVSSDLSNSENPYKKYSGELAGKVVAVIGMGNIGQEVARRMRQQHCRVIGWGYRRSNGEWSFSKADAAAMGIEWAGSVEEAVNEADAVCVHTPGSAGHVISESVLNNMTRKRVVLVNAARAQVTDKKAIGRAIAARAARGHSLVYYEDSDIFRGTEPGQLQGPLLESIELSRTYPDNVYFTPHWAGDRTPETDYNAAMQGYRQLREAVWNRRIFNAQTSVPEGFENAGAQLPASVGRANTEHINRVTSEGLADKVASLQRLQALLSLRQTRALTLAEACEYHLHLNRFAHAHTLQPEQASLLFRAFAGKPGQE